MSAWISVADRLPASGMPVLVYVPNARPLAKKKGAILRAAYTPANIVEYDPDDDDDDQDSPFVAEGWYETNEEEERHYRISAEVTHWQPMPEPPEVRS